MRKLLSVTLLLGLAVLLAAQVAQAAEFKIGIMQDAPGAAKEYGPLINLFKENGLEVKLQGYTSYPDAAIKFEKGEVDAMFAGSGVAGTMMIKKVAYPLLRPVTNDGFSTYWAVVLAPKGSPMFTGDPAYFKDKKIMCSALASSGEFYARSILGKDRGLMKAGSHGVAIDGIAKGLADVAIVKNRVWDKVKDKYPAIVLVGQDTGENPDNTLIVSYKTDKAVVAKVESVLYGVEADTSAAATEVKTSLKISKYIPTSEEDFKHTLALLEKAAVTPEFNFSY
jgi:ABC-type phosphate/phosphonate transport system substrate-binding protein